MRRILTLCLLLLLALSAGCSSAPDNSDQVPPSDKAPVVTVTSLSLQSETKELESRLEIPVLSGLEDKELEKQINADLENKALAFKADIEKAAAEFYADAKKNGWEAPGPCSVHTSFTVPYNKDGILSLCVTYYGFSGGAHGSTHIEALNLDTRTGKTLSLKDFFEPGENYQELVADQICEQIAARPLEFYEDAAASLEISADQPFYVTDGAVVIYFGQYEIAPYSTGIPEFKIPVTVMP